jgi:secreted trypsin-like serine protease
VFCGLSSSQSVMVCCSKNFVSSKPHCPYLDEEYTEKSTCGRRFSTVSQITGGSKTEPGDWPWMARLLYNFPNETSKSVTNCGGTLISRRHVVTAGHCITEDVKPIAVALGDSDVTTDYDCLDVKSGYGCRTTGAACAAAEECAPKHIEVKIKDFIIHHKYKYENRRKFLLNFDVAMIVLEEPVTFSDFIQPVCLPNPKEQSQGPLTETGWGNTVASPGRKKSALILQELDVNEVPLDECRRKWKPKLKEDLLTSHMCASTGIPRSTSCIGDSGGPLVRNSDFQKQIWELAGVVSFGTKTCGNVDYPLAFTRVEGEVNLWLREIVGRELPGHS